MNRFAVRSLVVALVLCLSFGSVYAIGHGSATAISPGAGIWNLIWDALSSLWLEGSSLDPFGNPPEENSDAGSHLEPFGAPAASKSDAGSSLDPFGNPSGATSDYGAGYDPDGKSFVVRDDAPSAITP